MFYTFADLKYRLYLQKKSIKVEVLPPVKQLIEYTLISSH